MTFKKDYINYLLYTVVNSHGSGFEDNYRMKKLVDSIILIDDVMKITFLIGKTAGLELLFKYLLYVSDKIDKSRVTVFNLKDNFEYDIMNLTKICRKISDYKSENVREAIENITAGAQQQEDDKIADTIKIELGDTETPVNLFNIEDGESTAEDTEEDSGDSKLTLIENTESYKGETEVFELESISDSVENSDNDEKQEIKAENEKPGGGDTGEDTDESTEETSGESQEVKLKTTEEELETTAEDEPETHEVSFEKGEEVFEIESLDDETDDSGDESTDESKEKKAEEQEEITKEAAFGPELPEIEIEVNLPSSGTVHQEGRPKEESITNEAYYKFENKFFEEVKILEKLFASVDKESRINKGRLSEKCLQCLTEIVEISSELSNLSRQLSFDLIADIFFTMNIYFTKAISLPELLTSERIKLLDSSLALVNSLIKGEDYLNYDTIADKIEKLKSDISKAREEEYSEDKAIIEENRAGGEAAGIKDNEIKQTAGNIEKTAELKTKDSEMPPEQIRQVRDTTGLEQSQMDSAGFKLKYIVKEFEKSFKSIESLQGEYSKFDALEKITELNNALRLIAKISAEVKFYDVLKLAEVTYVFLKYVKDYRMDLLEPEIQQIVKYIIFTFKMLLTNRKPEDFSVLVRHLNNPVKIFTDT